VIRFAIRAVGLVLLLTSLAVSTLFLFALAPAKDGQQNQAREAVASRPWLRDLLGLHSYGDGKTDYLLPRYSLIQVEVDYVRGYAPSEAVRTALDTDLTALTGKEVEVSLSDELPLQESFTVADLARLRNGYRQTETEGRTAALYILVATTSAERPTNVGATLDENSLVLFAEEARSLPAYRTDALKLEESTILHEFGHLLGLEHSNSGVMAEHVEVNSGRIDPSNYWFSPEDLAKIRALRAKYAR
jgi:hypothetical protein